jgi:hypothetical protein
MQQTFGHGDIIKGYGRITGLYHTKTGTTYICWTQEEGYKYFQRSWPW